MDYSEMSELLGRGDFFNPGRGFTAGAILEFTTNRNLVALVMLHAAATNYPLDVPKCIDMAFKLADGYLKKCEAQSPKTEKPAVCKSCGKDIEETDLILIDPKTNKTVLHDEPGYDRAVAYHMNCAPPEEGA